ncbi:hypothetical protein ACQFX9_18930 [Aliinostoc sp. HNIBRCY26]|uniref:hypothetical protein n=1 Tax=Aliinostoc sp. HNIBRCY26 TaxID=3418997 RepID=UPI003D081F24
MFKKLPVVLVAATLLVTSLGDSHTSLAGTCASNCGPRPLQFTPGQRIRLEVVNNTSNIVELERIQGYRPISLRPGQKLQFSQEDNTGQNLSLVFWDEAGSALQAVVSKPNLATLRVEIRPTWRYPGDRSIYILNDGRVSVF